jgi:hypothetical protein
MSDVYHVTVTYSLDDGWGVDPYPPIDGAVWQPSADRWLQEHELSEGQRVALGKMRECVDMMIDRQNERARG